MYGASVAISKQEYRIPQRQIRINLTTTNKCWLLSRESWKVWLFSNITKAFNEQIKKFTQVNTEWKDNMEKIVELKDPMHNSKLLSNQIALPFGVSRITKSTTIID